MPPPRQRRRRKLIRPDIQLRLIAGFLGMAAIGMMLQFLLVAQSLMRIAARLPADGAHLSAQIPGTLTRVLLVSFLLLLPLLFGLGVLLTFRIAGPLYRFEQHLRAIARGEDPGPCRIRKDDQLHDFCAVLNEAVDALRSRALPEGEEERERAA